MPKIAFQSKELSVNKKSFAIKKDGLVHDLIKNKSLYVLAVPGILFFLVFAYFPMVGIIIAFKDYNVIDGIFRSPFIGLQNFAFLIKSQDIYRVTFNTLFLNTLFIVFGTLAQILIALLLNEIGSTVFKKVSQTVILLPYLISWVIVGVISYYLFEPTGFLNIIIKTIGLKPVDWYSSPQYWPAILTFSYIWKWVGYGSVIFLAAIVGIDQQIYEAARTDGCNRWGLIRYMTLPSLRPTVIILVLLAVGRIFYGDFGMVLNIVKNNVMVFNSTDIIDYYIYRALNGSGGSGGGSNIGMGSAAGLLQSALGFITILIANKLVNKIDKDSALF